MKNQITILRNKLTGLFFDGTNFSAEDALKAKRVGNASEVAIKSIWGENTQVITITDLPADADEGASFEADLAKGCADRAQARQWAVARAFRYENALADY